MKKLLLFGLSLMLIILMSACKFTDHTNENRSEKTQAISQNIINSNETISIYENNQFLDRIEHFGYIFQTQDGFVYSKWASNDSNRTTVMEYYHYYFDASESVKLGNIENWSFQTHESALVNNHLYFYISTGDYTSEENSSLLFVDVDLVRDCLVQINSEKGGFPYDTMKRKGDCVLLNKVVTNGSCLQEYNTVTGKIKQLKFFDFDDQNVVGEAVRNISVNEDKKTISLLMLRNKTKEDASLNIDTYDYDMNLLNSIDISPIFTDSNELIQGVTFFDYINDYLYYENFSITRYLGVVNNKKIDSPGFIDQSFELSYETENNQEPKLFYQYGNENNYLYLFDANEGKMLKATYKTNNDRYYIIGVSRNKNNLLVTMGYKDPQTAKTLESRLFHVKMSDLKFETKNTLLQ